MGKKHIGYQPRSVGLLPFAILLLASLTVWLPPEYQKLILPAAVVPWLCSAADAIFSRQGKVWFQALIRDPGFWCSLGFVTLLTIQWQNSGRNWLPPDDIGSPNQYGPPPIPWLPSSFVAEQSVQMLIWFVPALSAFILCRLAFSEKAWNILLVGLFANATVNAIVSLSGLLPKIEGEPDRGMTTELLSYGSFGYANHAAVYFVALLGLGFGLFLAECLKGADRRKLLILISVGAGCLVLLLTAHMTTSRFGVLGAWLVVGLSIVYITCMACKRVHPVQWVYIFTGVLAVGLAAALVFANVVDDRAKAGLRSATLELDISSEWEGRAFQYESAYQMWLDHPMFGVGGWGYRFLASQYVPKEKWRQLALSGKANVHNDFLNYLVEFGAVGVGLWTLPVVLVLLPILRRIRTVRIRGERVPSLWHYGISVLILVGLLAVLLNSLFDIPLRSPAILLHTLVLLAAAAHMLSRQPDWFPTMKLLSSEELRVKHLAGIRSEPDGSSVQQKDNGLR